MALDALDYQEILKRECNVTEDTVVDSTVPLWWEMYSSKANLELQYWYTRRHVLMYLQGKTRKLIDITIGPDRQMLSQQFKAVTVMLAQAEKELERIDPNYNSRNVPEFSVTDVESSLPDTFKEKQDLWEAGIGPYPRLTSTQTGLR